MLPPYRRKYFSGCFFDSGNILRSEKKQFVKTDFCVIIKNGDPIKFTVMISGLISIKLSAEYILWCARELLQGVRNAGNISERDFAVGILMTNVNYTVYL